jgi:hypothetical protein
MNRFVSFLVALVMVAALVSPVLAVEVAGTVKSVNAGQNQFVLTDTNGRDWTIQVGPNAQIQAGNNNQAKIGDLQPGQAVSVSYELQNNVLMASQVRGAQQAQQAQAPQQQPGQPAGQQPARQVGQQPAQQVGQQPAQQAGQQGAQAARQAHQVRGKVEKLDAEQHQFTLRDQNNRELTFRCGRDARINGQEGNLKDLKQGQEVTVSFNQELTDIRAGQQQQQQQQDQQPQGQKQQGQKQQGQKQQGQKQDQMIQGKIDRVDAAQNQIQLRDQSGKEHTFQVGRNVQVQLNGRNATLADLQQGQEVTATRQMVARDIRTDNQQQNQNQNRNPNPNPNPNR